MQICTVIRFLFKLHLLLAIVWLVSACGTEENRGTGNYGLVGLVIQADHYLMKAGDVLHVTFRIENGAKDVRVFESANTPVLDIVINSGPTWSVENP
jgi:hypothetical protein